MPEALIGFVYLAGLILSLGGMLLIDHRFSLFVFSNPMRAAAVLVIGVAFFLLWDAGGIALGIFFQGTGPYMTGVVLAPELPLEEVVFLTFLCHLTMVLTLGAHRLLQHRRSAWAN
ncbi:MULTISPECIES: lycopene cyclase domain-containing protein [Nesterenkonia]|uniref:lycopene cyclase domain-containing protein n=1 Tax=Nesterenkonia TaxID=57494 RepID=UPI001AEFAA98|nr:MULTISPECIES: lycopene cyclase domain-containing protein [Nesterenkonia]